MARIRRALATAAVIAFAVAVVSTPLVLQLAVFSQASTPHDVCITNGGVTSGPNVTLSGECVVNESGPTEPTGGFTGPDEYTGPVSGPSQPSGRSEVLERVAASPESPSTRMPSTGIYKSCDGEHSDDFCTDEEGSCFLFGFTPSIFKDAQDNHHVRARSAISCNPPVLKIHVGTMAIIRHYCNFAFGAWICSVRTQVHSEVGHFCGFQPLHDDDDSCDASAGPPPGYIYVDHLTDYDQRDGGQCRAFQLTVSGSFKAQNGVTHVFRKITTAGRLFGARNAGHDCKGTVGQYDGSS